MFYLFRCIQNFLCIKYSDNDGLKKGIQVLFTCLRDLIIPVVKAESLKGLGSFFQIIRPLKVSFVKNVENLHFLRILLFAKKCSLRMHGRA